MGAPVRAAGHRQLPMTLRRGGSAALARSTESASFRRRPPRPAVAVHQPGLRAFRRRAETCSAEQHVRPISVVAVVWAMFSATRGSLLVAVLFHFRINEAIWPNALLWAALAFTIAGIATVRSTARGEDGVSPWAEADVH